MSTMDPTRISYTHTHRSSVGSSPCSSSSACCRVVCSTFLSLRELLPSESLRRARSYTENIPPPRQTPPVTKPRALPLSQSSPSASQTDNISSGPWGVEHILTLAFPGNNKTRSHCKTGFMCSSRQLSHMDSSG